MRASILAVALLVSTPAHARPLGAPGGAKLMASAAVVLAVGVTLLGLGLWGYTSASQAPNLDDFNLRKSLSDSWAFGGIITVVGIGLLAGGAAALARERRVNVVPNGVSVRF